MIDFGLGVYLDRIIPNEIQFLRLERNNFDIRRWCRQKDLIHPAEQELWYQRQAEDPSIEMYAIQDTQSHNLVGVCGLTDVDRHNRNAEFSLYILPKEHRKGYASKGLKTLFNHGFWNLGLNMIWGESFENNPARELFKKIGMSEDGKKREAYYKHGQFVDSYFYTVTMREWEKLPHSVKLEV